jgi:hypothetical protein
MVADMMARASSRSPTPSQPDGHLVLYYDDAAPYWNGIVRIGELDGDMAAVERLPEGTGVTIEPTG